MAVASAKAPAAEANPFVEFVRLYRGNPVAFVREVLGASPDERQSEILAAIAGGKRRIAVRSGHGVGKSTVASWAMLWFLLTRIPVKVVVTAPTSAQLYDALFAELKRWTKALPPLLQQLVNVTNDRVELRAAPEEAFISARTARAEQPEALQGIHAEWVMLVADEASGVPESVFSAAAGSMSGHNAVTLLLGNPVRSSGYFFDAFHRLRDEWEKFHISCLDSPRVSREYVEEMRARFGEDSNTFRFRVLGEFPLSDDDTVIAAELIESASKRDVAVVESAPVVWGLDVARFGTDSTALVERKGNHVTQVRTWKGLDLMQVCGVVHAEYGPRRVDRQPAEILVDSIGLGAGVVDRLRELDLPVRGVNVSESPSLAGTYGNLRAELWFRMKEWFGARDCLIPADDRLFADLAAVRYRFNSGGRMLIESKDEIRKRGLPSPDLGDALALTFASTAAAFTPGNGAQAGKYNWRKPLRRNLSLC